jgi:hypothetical protein
LVFARAAAAAGVEAFFPVVVGVSALADGVTEATVTDARNAMAIAM